MSKHALALAAALVAFNAQALTAGDMAFTAFNADEDGFALVALTDLAADTTVYFTDNEWNGLALGSGGAFNTGESYSVWHTGGLTISAGTVIRFSAVDNKTNMAASVGSFSRETVSGNSNWGLANSGETLYAYLGTNASTPTAFLAAITNGSFTSDGSLDGTGLTEGVDAIRLNTLVPSATPDFGEYVGSRDGAASFADYLPLLANAANWTVDTVNGSYASTVPDTTAFTVATPAVPEPQSLALVLGGAGVAVVLTRRRRVL